MKKTIQFLNTHPWILVLLANVFYVGGVVLFLAVGIGIGISQSYHPDGGSKTLMPMSYTLLGIASIFALLSFVAWFRWRRVTGVTIAKSIGVYVLLLVVGGFVSYSLEPSKPEFRTYEHGGYTYTIPRAYSPSFHRDRLTIKYCEQDPTVGRYDYALLSEIKDQCQPATVAIESANDIFFIPLDHDTLFSGEKGFTIATSSNGLLLVPEFDKDLLAVNNLQLIETEEMTLIQTTQPETHGSTLYIEATNDQLGWLTMCRGITCHNFVPLTEDPRYVLVLPIFTRSFYETDELTTEMIQDYKQRAVDMTSIFEGFRVK